MRMRLNLSETLSHWGKYYPEKSAILTDNNSINYGEFNKIVEYLAQDISEQFGNQNYIAIMFEKRDLFLYSLYAIKRSNNHVVIINPGITENDILKCLEDANVTLLLTNENIDDSFNGKLKKQSIQFKLLNEYVIKEKLNQKNPYHDWPNPRQSDIWGILYSSGTTDKPKGIIRTNFSILSELLGWIIELELTKSTHFYIARPIFYTGGLVLALSCLMIGCTVSLISKHSKYTYKNYIDNHNVSISFLIPEQIDELIEYHQNNKSVKLKFHTIITMGSPTSLELKKKSKGCLNSILIESWGNSEGLGTITESTDIDIRPASIGRPFLTDELFIADESMNKLSPNEIGRIGGIADSNFSGYNNRDDLNKECVKTDFILSDDLGYMDHDGYFYLKGRISDKIICNGNNIYPKDIEGKLKLLDEIEEVSIIGLSSKTMGEAPYAVIKINPKYIKIKKIEVLAKINAVLGKDQQIYHFDICSFFNC